MDLVKNNEPHLALYADDDGLFYYKKIFEEIKSYLNEKYLLFFELNSEKAKEIYDLAKNKFNNDKITIKRDLNGLERVLIIESN